MAYALLADIDARYPGELAQAGPRDINGGFDIEAVDLALAWASTTIDRTLRVLGWSTPVAAPVPAWIKDLTVDLSLYQATPTAMASQADFSDRRRRYEDALAQLDAIAKGELMPPPPASNAALQPVYVVSNARVFERGW